MRIAPPKEANTVELPPALSNKLLQSAFLGDSILAGRVLSLWLQARDTQSGALVANKKRDYALLSNWIVNIHNLDPQSAYALMLAGRVYSQVSDDQRTRLMLDLVQELFQADPVRFWRWQAEAAVQAKHKLGDKEYALSLAQDMVARTPSDVLPYWARDIQIILLQDLGKQKELELLIGGLVTSGQVTDEEELQWLNQQLIKY